MTLIARRLSILMGWLVIVTSPLSADADKPAPELASSATDEVVAMTEAELRRGKIAYLQCRSCHSVERDGPHLTGPNLNGLFGARAASKSGYAYSSALSESGIIWTAETLDAWLKNPAALVSGNRMAFAGVPSESDRALLVRYLATVTKP